MDSLAATEHLSFRLSRSKPNSWATQIANLELIEYVPFPISIVSVQLSLFQPLHSLPFFSSGYFWRANIGFKPRIHFVPDVFRKHESRWQLNSRVMAKFMLRISSKSYAISSIFTLPLCSSSHFLTHLANTFSLQNNISLV